MNQYRNKLIWQKRDRAFRRARVFISHSWDPRDCMVADLIAEITSRQCEVEYDRNNILGIGPSIIELGQPVVPVDAIRICDFFLFIASEASTRKGSFARDELRAAQGLGLLNQGRLGLVLVDDFTPPSAYKKYLFQRVRIDRLVEDCNVVVSRVLQRLTSLGGVVESAGRITGGARPSALIDRIMNFAPQASLFELDLPLQKWATRYLMHEVEKLDQGSRDLLVNKLFEVICGKASALANNNALYVISRLQPGEQAYGVELLRVGGLHSDPYSRLSLSTASAVTGRGETLRTYLDFLLSDSVEGRKLRRYHKAYHLFYYGGYNDAIEALRREIVAKVQPELLPLTLSTYGLLEKSDLGIRLVRKQARNLRDSGVDKVLITRVGNRLASDRRRM